MTKRDIRHNDDLTTTVLEIIGLYQPILTMDIWYELGEDGRFEDRVAVAEVNETLSLLENRKRIAREDGDKWRLKGSLSETRRKTKTQAKGIAGDVHIYDMQG